MLYIIIIICYFIDIITKKAAIYYIWDSKIELFWDFVYLQTLTNTGIAFSIPLSWVLLKIITLILISAIFVYYIKWEEKKKWNTISYWLLLWWAIWNAHERIIYSWVTDFIWVKYFAVFNMADSFICIWIFILLLQNYAKPSITAK